MGFLHEALTPTEQTSLSTVLTNLKGMPEFLLGSPLDIYIIDMSVKCVLTKDTFIQSENMVLDITAYLLMGRHSR